MENLPMCPGRSGLGGGAQRSLPLMRKRPNKSIPSLARFFVQWWNYQSLEPLAVSPPAPQVRRADCSSTS
ncbi:MAG: hypothetical protein QNJ55_35295 [Xenococcus sp. MO_188.B8]|nr:hypothetical protein [Xenococcus sp. MO_188.B8]